MNRESEQIYKPEEMANNAGLNALAASATTGVYRTRLEQELCVHEEFAAKLRRTYVERSPYLEELDAYAEGTDAPLIIAGPAGSGKSTLLAWWTEHYRKNHPDAFVVAYYTEAAAPDADPGRFLRQVVTEVHQQYGCPDDIAATLEDALVSMPCKGLLVVMDGLERLEHCWHGLEWLPRQLPAGMHLVVSTHDDALFARLIERDWPVIRLRPLSIADRRRVVDRVLQISLEPISHSHWKCNNPLFLRAHLEQRRTTEQESLSYLTELLAATDIHQLFEIQLTRIERLHGVEEVRNVLTLIMASRYGLAESELLHLTSIAPEALAALLHSLDTYLSYRDGLISLFHDTLRVVIAQRYAPSDGLMRKLHRRLGQYFSRQPISRRRAQEEPWQWAQGHRWAALRDCITIEEMFLELATMNMGSDLFNYWHQLGKWFDMESVSPLLHQKILQGEISIQFGSQGSFGILNSVGDEDCNVPDFHAAERAYVQSIEMSISQNDSNHHEVVSLLNKLAVLYHAQRLFDKAEAVLRQALQRSVNSFGKNHPITANVLNNLGTCLRSLDRLSEAGQCYEQAVNIVEAMLGPYHPLTISYMNSRRDLLKAQENVYKPNTEANG